MRCTATPRRSAGLFREEHANAFWLATPKQINTQQLTGEPPMPGAGLNPACAIFSTPTCRKIFPHGLSRYQSRCDCARRRGNCATSWRSWGKRSLSSPPRIQHPVARNKVRAPSSGEIPGGAALTGLQGRAVGLPRLSVAPSWRNPGGAALTGATGRRSAGCPAKRRASRSNPGAALTGATGRAVGLPG